MLWEYIGQTTTLLSGYFLQALGIPPESLRIYCVLEVFEEYLLRRLKKHFQDLFRENYGGVFYNNNLVESCIGFAACSRSALVRASAPLRILVAFGQFQDLFEAFCIVAVYFRNAFIYIYID